MSGNANKCYKAIADNILLFVVLLAESLVVIPSTVFTILYVFCSSEDHYKTYHPELSGIIGFHLLLPIFIYQILWLLSNITSAVTVLTNASPYIFFVSILVPMFGLVVSIVILVPSVNYVIVNNFHVNGFFLGFVCALSIFIIAMILFTISRVSTLRKLMKKKKVTQNTAEKSPEDPPQEAVEPALIRMKDPDEISTTFSRRSTMSMNDELYVPPPRY